jgi:hypothetical protein
MGEDGEKDDRIATAPEEPRERPGKLHTLRYYFTEALREIGVLTMVFSGIDTLVNNGRLSRLGLLGWIGGGLVALLVGINFAPEVRR